MVVISLDLERDVEVSVRTAHPAEPVNDPESWVQKEESYEPQLDPLLVMDRLMDPSPRVDRPTRDHEREPLLEREQ